MIIREQHLPGGWRYDPNGFTPKKPWPEDCVVQWGGRGVVLGMSAGTEPYITAFFEAFPNDPKTFIRGEGKTEEEAEEAAWQEFQRYLACDGHVFSRDRKRKNGTVVTYTNGAGFCEKCQLFSSDQFEPIPAELEEEESAEDSEK